MFWTTPVELAIAADQTTEPLVARVFVRQSPAATQYILFLKLEIESKIAMTKSDFVLEGILARERNFSNHTSKKTKMKSVQYLRARVDHEWVFLRTNTTLVPAPYQQEVSE